MSVFRFKQFAVKQSDAAMKVGTDSVLLGCLVQSNNPLRVLDIGTGTGLLALMMAQRFESAQIDAVEIEKAAYLEALFNIGESPWGDRITITHQSFNEFANLVPIRYDLIVSNPPYYEAENHFAIQEDKRSTARHTGTLSYTQLLAGIQKLLGQQGSCWMVLPTQVFQTILEKALEMGFFLTTMIRIFAKANKPHNRVIFQLKKISEIQAVTDFVIYNEGNDYTSAYKKATMPFLLWK
jgi:tRNA1Val (adenine37-N6)-methyltransferase